MEIPPVAGQVVEMQFNYCVLMCLLWFNDSPGKLHGTRRSQSHLFAEERDLLKVQPVVERSRDHHYPANRCLYQSRKKI